MLIFRGGGGFSDASTVVDMRWGWNEFALEEPGSRYILLHFAYVASIVTRACHSAVRFGSLCSGQLISLVSLCYKSEPHI